MPSQTAENSINERSFFFDCNLESPVLNTLLVPKQSLLNFLTATPTLQATRVYNSLVSDDDGITGSEPNDECSVPPIINEDFDFCKLQFDLGRINRLTKTLEVDTLIEKSCARAFEDLYLVGDWAMTLRNMSMSEIMGQQNLIVEGAVRKQMQILGHRFNKELGSMLWNGDTTNNVGTGYEEFFGLLRLVTDTYGTDATLPVTAETGTQADCATLNSDLKDFGSNCVGGGQASLYEYLYELEDTLMMRAVLQGVEVRNAVWVMNPLLWSQITKYLPCEIAGDGCSVGTIQANDGGSGMFAQDMRNQMRSQNTLTLNGRTWPVVFDNFIPYTTGTDAGTGRPYYESDIFFIPITVAGNNGLVDVTRIEYKNYNEIAPALGPADNSFNDARGWTDGGRYHFIITNTRRCFEIDAKIEPTLVFIAPHLAGRIQNVRVCPLQAKPEPNITV